MRGYDSYNARQMAVLIPITVVLVINYHSIYFYFIVHIIRLSIIVVVVSDVVPSFDISFTLRSAVSSVMLEQRRGG